LVRTCRKFPVKTMSRRMYLASHAFVAAKVMHEHFVSR
jgi:hypothetical protein